MAEKPLFRQLLEASTVGLNLVLSTFVGLAIGYGLDYLFHTSPWLTIIFLIIGIITGFQGTHTYREEAGKWTWFVRYRRVR